MADGTAAVREDGPVDHVPRPLLQAIVTAAVDATAAGAGWIASVVDGTDLAAVAVASGDPTIVDRVLWHRTGLGSGAAGMVVQSGQPIALGASGSTTIDPWASALLGRDPTSLVCVPCHDDDQPVGALQLVDRVGGGPFTFDDVEIATLLAPIAGAALAEGAGAASRVASPAQLGADLGRLADADPARYAAIAQAVAALVAQS
jgi:GAF domain-containing protein